MWDVQLAPGVVQQRHSSLPHVSLVAGVVKGLLCEDALVAVVEQESKINSVGPKSGLTWTAFEEMCVNVNSRR